MAATTFLIPGPPECHVLAVCGLLLIIVANLTTTRATAANQLIYTSES